MISGPISALRQPATTRASTSRPSSSVPRRCADDGRAATDSGSIALGDWKMNVVPTTANSTTPATNTNARTMISGTRTRRARLRVAVPAAAATWLMRAVRS